MTAVIAAYELQNTISRFALAIDDHDLDGIVALFTDDAELEVTGRPGPQKGRAEIRALFADVLAQGWQGQHASAPAILEIDGDEAQFVASFTYLRFEDGFRFQTAGRYEGVLHRGGDRWLFARLAVRVLARV
ncbi:MAG TPA: nuclear transport factor 2 family protein [Acidimicrobiia bacterium]|nr:nuclear transport factor 2 family protein [Acidimicrobiia bacterium]